MINLGYGYQQIHIPSSLYLFFNVALKSPHNLLKDWKPIYSDYTRTCQRNFIQVSTQPIELHTEEYFSACVGITLSLSNANALKLWDGTLSTISMTQIGKQLIRFYSSTWNRQNKSNKPKTLLLEKLRRWWKLLLGMQFVISYPK